MKFHEDNQNPGNSAIAPLNKNRISLYLVLSCFLLGTLLLVRPNIIVYPLYLKSRLLGGSNVTIGGSKKWLPTGWWIQRKSSEQIICVRLPRTVGRPSLIAVVEKRTVPFEHGIPKLPVSIEREEYVVKAPQSLESLSLGGKNIFFAAQPVVYKNENGRSDGEVYFIWVIPSDSLTILAPNAHFEDKEYFLELVRALVE